MLDLALVGFIGLFLALGLKRPFFWVLAYIYIDVVAPQKIGWGFIQSLPVSLIAFAAAFAGWLFLDTKHGSRFTLRQALILALLAYCGITTLGAAFPEAAWTKWDWVWKALVFAAFLPLTLRTRLRIEAAALIMVLSIGTIIINGGLKTALGGGGYGVLSLLVREDAGLYEGSILSTAAIATIPLVLWLARHGTIFKPDWMVRLFAGGLIFACLLIPVGTSARTGLVAAAVLGALMLRSVRYKFLYAGLGALALLAAVPFLPQTFLERMGTITNYEGDESASTRVQVWKWTIEYATENPFGGGFDVYLGNSFTYETRKVDRRGQQPHDRVQRSDRQIARLPLVVFRDARRAGLAGADAVAVAAGARRVADGAHPLALRKREGGRANLAMEPRHGAAAVAADLSGRRGFVGIAYQPFIFMLIGLQCALWSYVKRTEAIPKKASFRRHEANKPLPATA